MRRVNCKLKSGEPPSMYTNRTVITMRLAHSYERIRPLALFTSLLLILAAGVQAQPPRIPIFVDSFDGGQLDTSRWIAADRKAPGSACGLAQQTYITLCVNHQQKRDSDIFAAYAQKRLLLTQGDRRRWAFPATIRSFVAFPNSYVEEPIHER